MKRLLIRFVAILLGIVMPYVVFIGMGILYPNMGIIVLMFSCGFIYFTFGIVVFQVHEILYEKIIERTFNVYTYWTYDSPTWWSGTNRSFHDKTTGKRVKI